MSSIKLKISLGIIFGFCLGMFYGLLIAGISVIHQCDNYGRIKYSWSDNYACVPILEDKQ